MEVKKINIEKKLKEEKGSVAVLVLITIIAFLIVLTAFYFRSTYVRKSQLQTDALLKNVYESQVNDEITQYSWKSYVQDGLMLHYDGINNTGNGHSEDAEVWKDLSGNGNDGTLNGTNYLEASGWKEKCLKMDGVNDWIDTGLPANTTFTPNSDFTMSITVAFNTISNAGTSDIVTEDGDTGTLFGGMGSNGGYGIFWTTKKTDNKTINIESGAREQDTENYIFNKAKVVNANEKVNFVFSYSKIDKKLRVYLNGELFDEKGEFTAADWGTTLNNISINKNEKIRGDFAPAYADINVYSAMIYNKTLTAEEIAENYKVDRQRFEI